MPAKMAGKSNPSYTHGGCIDGKVTAEYKAWSSMWERCSNSRHISFARYGGRGIKVCKRWEEFAAFKEDMGTRPRGYSLERIDNDGDYRPGNCVWAPRGQQSENRSTTIFITIGKRTQSLARWAREFGVGVTTAHWRIRNGWDPVRAVSYPARSQHDNADPE